MLDRTLIGRESEPVVHEVEKGAVRRFAEALGDPNPLYQDEGAARAAGYASLLAPPTFPVTLTANERFRHSLDLGTRSLLHGEQAFEYGDAVRPGDALETVGEIVDVRAKSGLEFLTVKTTTTNQRGRTVVTGTWKAVVRP
jgi:acyl dehydratase